MHEARPVQRNWLRQVVFPLLIAVVLVVGALLVCGSSLIRIEDVYINRILAGTYGVPDWRVQEMNPLLAQFLTLLYRLIPSVNWYGVLLLALVWLSSACVISLAARKRGGLIPVAIVISPIAVLLTHSLQSTVVAALCVASMLLTSFVDNHVFNMGPGLLYSVLLVFGEKDGAGRPALLPCGA